MDRHIDIDDIPSSDKGRETTRVLANKGSQTKTFVEPDDISSTTGPSPNPDRMKEIWNRQNFLWNKNTIEKIIPPEALKHFRASRLEFLLACQTFIHTTLEKMDNSENRAEPIPPATNPFQDKVYPGEEVDF